MVKFWDEMLKFEIARTKKNIGLCEKHGVGDTAMREKARLKKQERTRDKQ